MLPNQSQLDVFFAKRLSGEESLEESSVVDALVNEYPAEWDLAQKGWDNAQADWFYEPAMKPVFHQPVKRNSYRWLAVAASLILIAMISFFLIRENDVASYAILTETKTKAGEQKELTLPDGSRVRMNAQSTLRYPEEFAGNIREVYLEGEAYFEVSSDKKKPFLIHGTEANINVLGTSFNVSAYLSEPMAVAVRSGKVTITSHAGSAKEALMVPMMKKGITHRASGIWKVEQATERDFDWLENRLAFDQTPLSEVIEKLSRHYGVSIKLSNAELSNCRISATFYRNTLEEVLETLSLIADLQVELHGDHYTIGGKGC